MKKITSVLLAVLIMASTICAGAATPDFLKDVLTNYTSDYTFSMSFDNSEEVVKLLKEIEFPEEVSYFVDIESLLRTLLTFDGKMHLKSDISDDCSKLKIALTTESSHKVDINDNLKVGVDAKTGMWMNMDLSAESPVFDIVYSYPFTNKYMKIDATALTGETGVIDMLKAIYNKTYMETLQSMYADLFVKYATVESSGNKYTIKMDNDGFVAYLNEIFLMMPTIMESMMPDGKYDSYLEMPSLDGWQLLGDDGLVCEVMLSGGKIKTEKFKADISVDVAEIYTSLTGMDWDYEADGTIDFTVSMDADISNIGKTKVDFPELTEENSFTIDDMMPEYETVENEEYPQYPLWYVSEYCEYLPVIDGQVYVPLRQTLNSAYEESVAIDYNNGVVTMTSDYFKGFKSCVVTLDSISAKFDGKESIIMKPVLIDGKTYVSNTFFTEIFGWEFSYASHDLVNNEYYYTFWTHAD